MTGTKASLLTRTPDMTATHPRAATDAAYIVIFGVALGHLLNDVMQSLVTAIYPLLQVEFSLAFWQIGLLSFAFQVTASILQPVVGNYTDKNPMPQSLAFGMGSTLVGILLLAVVHSYWLLVLGAMLIGVGSAIFHPEASRVARFASGGRYGTAQSLFQVGGNIGTAIGPLLAAFIVVPLGRPSLLWFSVGALVGIVVLRQVGSWYSRYRATHTPVSRATRAADVAPEKVRMSLIILALLVFTKNIYTASFSSYYTFFPDRTLQPHSAAVATHAVRVSGGDGGWCHHRRPDRGPVWGAHGDLVFNPRGLALHARAALRRTDRDGYPDGADRSDHRFGLSGDPCLCAGTGAGTDRDDQRRVLWVCLWHGWYRCGGAGCSCGLEGAGVRFLYLFLVAGHGASDGFSPPERGATAPELDGALAGSCTASYV